MEDLSGGVLSLDHQYKVLKRHTYEGVAQRYKGRQLPLNLPVDIWVVDVGAKLGVPSAAAEAIAARMEALARQATLLRSPHVFRLLDYVETEEPGVPFFLTESARGPSLADIISHQGTLPVDGTVKVVEEVALALTDMHKAGFGHFGVRPEHVWFEQTPTGAYARLSAFGFTLLRHEVGLIDTEADLSCVWVDHLAPESFDSDEVRHWRRALTSEISTGFDGEWQHDASPTRSLPPSPAPMDPVSFDVFGLAVMTYRCLTGRHPFIEDESISVAERFKALADGEVIDPARYGVALPDEVWRVLRRGLARDPGARPSSALDFAQALSKAAEPEAQAPEALNAVAEEPTEGVEVFQASQEGPELLGDLVDLDAEAAPVEAPLKAWGEESGPMAQLFEVPLARYLVAAVTLLLVTNLITLMLLAASGPRTVAVSSPDASMAWSERNADGVYEPLEESPSALPGDRDAAYRLEGPLGSGVELEWSPEDGLTISPRM